MDAETSHLTGSLKVFGDFDFGTTKGDGGELSFE